MTEVPYPGKADNLMTIRSASFTPAFFKRDPSPQISNTSPGPSSAGHSSPVYFRHGDDTDKFREFMANLPLFEQCKTEYRDMLDRLKRFAEQAGPKLSPPLTGATLEQIQQNIGRLQHNIANPSDPLRPGTAMMYGLGKERFHDLVALMEERSSSPHKDNQQRHLARRMDVLQTLAPHLGVCSGGVITALEDALASLRPQNMGIAGKARDRTSQFLRDVALARVKSNGNNRRGSEVHRTNAIYNKLAHARGFPQIADQYAEWPANQPTEQDMSNCERQVDAHLKPPRVLRPVAEAYLDEVQGAVSGGARAGEGADDIYMQLHTLMKDELDVAYGPVNPYSVLVSQSDNQDPSIARYPDLLAADFTRALATQGLVETGNEVSLGKTDEIAYARGTGSAGGNKRRRLENPGKIMQWAGLFWLNKGTGNTELPPGQLLNLQPSEMLRNLRRQGISEMEQAEIFQSLAEHVFASRERESITQISSDWLNDLATVIEQFSAETRQGLVHAAVMLACTFNHPDAMRRLHQLQLNSGQTAQGRQGEYLNNPAPTGELPMTVAAIYGHHEMLTLLAQFGANINIRDSQGLTPVLHAALHGQAAVLQTLIAARANIDEANENGIPAVLLAAARNHAPVVALLMDASPAARSAESRFFIMTHAARQQSDALMAVLRERQTPLEVKNGHGITPLLNVIANNDPGAVRFLIGHGANIESPDPDGLTPLLVAAMLASPDIAKYLLACQANLDHLDNRQSTALMWAAMSGNYLTLEALINAKAAGGPQALQQFVNRQDISGGTALMKAAAKGDPRSVRLLIYAHADLEVCDSKGTNALSYAAMTNAETVRALLEAKEAAGADHLALYVNHRNHNARTALMIAAISGTPDVVTALIEAHADLDAQDCNNSTALSHAARRGVIANVEILVRNGADLDLTDDFDESPLIKAIRGHHEETALFLIGHGASTMLEDAGGSTPLMHAASLGSERLVRELMENYASLDFADLINRQDKEGMTALMIACANDHAHIVEVMAQVAGALVESGNPQARLDIEVNDTLGMNALMHASAKGNAAAVAALLSQGATLNFGDEEGATAMLHAARNGHAAVIAALTAAFPDSDVLAADVNLATWEGESPLMAAAFGGHINAVNALLMHRHIDIDAVDMEQRNALMYAASREPADPQIIATLLRKTENIYAADTEKMDVFQHAVTSKSLDALKECIAFGYDPKRSITRNGRHTAMVLAEEIGDQAIINYLSQDLRLN